MPPNIAGRTESFRCASLARHDSHLAGDKAGGVASIRQALRCQPNHAEAHRDLGNILLAAGQLHEAAECYRQAVRFKPRLAAAHNNLGVTLYRLGNLEQAIASYRQALSIRPDFAEAYTNLGTALSDQGRLEDAVASYREAVRINPEFGAAHFNLGNGLRQLGQLDEAVASYQQALRCPRDRSHLPNLGDVYTNLATALKEEGQLDEAIAAYQRAMDLKPERADYHSNLLFAQHYHPRYDAAALLEECRSFDRFHAAPLRRRPEVFTNSPEQPRRLRVGYVSPDFRNHCQSFFTIPLLSHHDHGQFDVFCYADVVRPDKITERLRGYADQWRTTVGRTDVEVADMVHRDQIDILVDLTMHMSNNRMLVFARRPAPVQVTWLAYPGTTGLSTMDYRLTDPYLDPPGEYDSCYAEQSVRLPDTFWCYDPLCEVPPVDPLPALQNGCITFGSLNNFCKVNDESLALWARTLAAVRNSRLLLLAPPGRARKRVVEVLQKHGIAPARAEFVGKQSTDAYLKTYSRIDVGLDPIPYHGHTTSLDAFWMGVPTISLMGRTIVGRAGWSMLSNLQLQELSARTPEQFVEITVKLADDLPRLHELRSSMRRRMLDSPLMDGHRFARNVEHAYREVWQRWCRHGVRA